MSSAREGSDTPSVRYTVSVRNLCAFAAKVGDLDMRFTPSPTAQQGREGHVLVAQRRGPDYESEVSLSGTYQGLNVRGRADGFDAEYQTLEEVKTFRGSVEAIAANHRALHWAQLKVYGWLLCQSRDIPHLRLQLVYLDVVDQNEHLVAEEHSADALRLFFEDLCGRFLGWARQETAHRARRDAALAQLAFPQKPFRTGQRELAEAVYRACVQGRPLLAQAPTGIGKTIGTLFPALRAMPVRGTDKLFFLTAKTPGRQVALDALQRLRAVPADVAPGADPVKKNGGDPARSRSDRVHALPLRVIELVARSKACEHKDKACHGQSCPLANGFYDRLPAARQAAADIAWLDRDALRKVALAHAVCPYYLGHEMLRWSDVVVGDYNYYFDRSAMLYALTVDTPLQVSVLVDEAHNLYARACGMYSADLTHAETLDVRAHVSLSLRGRLDELLNQWQLLQAGAGPQERDATEAAEAAGATNAAPRRAVAAVATPADSPAAAWRLLPILPGPWMRALQKFNSAMGEYLGAITAQAPGPVLDFYFRTLAFATLADEFGAHSLCEFDAAVTDFTWEENAGRLMLRNIVPAHFLTERLAAANALVLFSATLCPPDYYSNLLGLPQATKVVDIPSPFRPEQLAVRVQPISTRREKRAGSLDVLVDTMQGQYALQPGNYLAFFSSFDYLEMALQRLRERHPGIPVWVQQRQMDESSRDAFLQRFHTEGQGIGFAVLGGVFGEGVDLPGTRLIGAFVATLGLPQFDHINGAICARLEERFGRGHDYTYLYPGLQKVVQAAGRVIRTETDTGTVILLDARYRERKYRALLPSWWRLANPAS